MTREEGVLVKEITIRRGDTLSAISRTYSGHASYYPQILLFNQISNPDLIYAGATLRVPVSKVVKEAEAKKEKEKAAVAPARSERKRGAKASRWREEKKAPAVAPKEHPAPSVERGDEDGEQRLYEKAVTAYNNSSCSDALPVFERFLAKYPHSARVADIALFRADCHLKLSGE